MEHVTAADLAAWSALPDGVGEAPDGPLVVVDCGQPVDGGDRAAQGLAARLEVVPAVYVAVGAAPGDPVAGVLDVCVADHDGLTSVVDAVEANPLAATSLAVLLRRQVERSVGEGLLLESATYGLLQGGPEHRRWLAARSGRDRRRSDGASAVRVELDGGHLHITLDRPHVRNAFDARTRDALAEALAVAAADPRLEVLLDGAGPVFCSGGDLDEFGTSTDPATAHLVRLRRSVGRSLAAVAARTTVHVHGACVGAGVELAAFAGRVLADPGTTFRLPEVGMGLVPGAGGTVSIPRRIGRQRAALLALTGSAIDAPTALAWGLVDEIRPLAPA